MDVENKALVPQQDWSAIVELVTKSVDSPHSRRAYKRALTDFLQWYASHGQPGFTKATVNNYRAMLLENGKSRSSINQSLSAIRKLAAEAADNGLISPTLALSVERVKGVKQAGIRSGNWLTKEQAERLINTPMRRVREGALPELKGKRDLALLALLIGTGLRRSETAELLWEQIQQRDGRWAIINLIGKRGRIRSVGLPPWVKVALDNWVTAVGITSGRMFLALNKDGQPAGQVKTKGGTLTDGFMSSQAIYNTVKDSVMMADLVDAQGEPLIAAHDLRRTAAALALKGGADLRQIQQMLGHASITTTERYLEPMRSLQVTAGDFIQLELEVQIDGAETRTSG